MQTDPNPVAFGLVLVGAFLSLGREYIAKGYIWLHGKLKKQNSDPRLQKGVEIYLMLVGMIFTIVGVLGMFHVIEF